DGLDLVTGAGVGIELVDLDAVLLLVARDEVPVPAPVVRKGDRGEIALLLRGSDQLVHAGLADRDPDGRQDGQGDERDCPQRWEFHVSSSGSEPGLVATAYDGSAAPMLSRVAPDTGLTGILPAPGRRRPQSSAGSRWNPWPFRRAPSARRRRRRSRTRSGRRPSGWLPRASIPRRRRSCGAVRARRGSPA